MKKAFFFFAIMACTVLYSEAQTYQSEPDKMWGRACYRELNGKWLDANTQEVAMTTMPTTPGTVLAYYYRIPAGHVRADVIWQNVYARIATVNVKVIYPHTGQVLGTNTFGNTDILSEQRTSDLFGDINFPADDFYRIELTCDNWNYIKSINYFNYYRESTDPVLFPRNFGGTSAYLNTWGTTDPSAPTGKAYDWAYVEARCEKGNQYPGTYYMTIGTPTSYMGMQTNNAVGDDFNRNVLFSVWDDGNTDEEVLPDYRMSKVLAGNLDAVHTHAGGEGSSASVMFQNNPKWWADGHWIQFLLNTKPMTTPVTITTKDGKDSTFNYGYTIMSAWYKCDTMPDWRYMATIRAAGICENIAGWYDFIEPFTSAAGQFIHTVYHRHAAMRSAGSGRWYNRNKIYLGNDNITDRRYHYDYGRGVTQKYDNCYFLDMGGYVHQHDSSAIVPLAKDMSFVDTIDLDKLNRQVTMALARDDYYNFESRINKTAPDMSNETWSIVQNYTTSPENAISAIDQNETSIWRVYESPAYLALSSTSEQTVTSMEIYWTNQYGSRCHFVDVYTSQDGTNWDLKYDSLEIRCLDRIEVSFPQPINTKYLRFKFHRKYTSSNTLAINELTLRGAYNIDKLKALAKQCIDNAGTINNYSESDLAEVIRVYDNGNCSDAGALSDALHDVSVNGTFARTYQVSALRNVATDHTYFLQNPNGYGVLTVDTLTNSLSACGATSDGALTKYTNAAVFTSALNNWLILRDEKYSAYYLYNIGAKKFFNPDATNFLSNEPKQIKMTPWGRTFYFSSFDGKTVYGIDPTEQNLLTTYSSVNNNCLFYLYDNLSSQAPWSLIDSIKAQTEPLDKFVLYKSSVNEMLKAPIGVVGGFVSEEAREALQDAFNNADADPEAFLLAIDSADIIAFDPDNCLYRIELTEESLASAPYLTADASLRINTKSENNNPDQIWRFCNKNDGYILSSQGVMIRPTGDVAGETLTTTTTKGKSGTFSISEASWGHHWIANGEYAPIVVNGASSPVKTAASASVGSTWYIKPTTTATITMNSAGVNSAYFEYGFIVPEGLTAYSVDNVTADGVIKLRCVGDTVAANTPVILKGDNYKKYTLTLLNSQDTCSVSNLLSGVYFRNTSLEKSTYMTLATTSGKPVMKKPAISLINANQVYMLITADMPNLSFYTFDFDDIIAGVNAVETQNDAKVNTQTYTINGLPATSIVKGNIYIQNHKKVLAQ